MMTDVQNHIKYDMGKTVLLHNNTCKLKSVGLMINAYRTKIVQKTFTLLQIFNFSSLIHIQSRLAFHIKLLRITNYKPSYFNLSCNKYH